jgi:hypothetical protein
MDQNWFVTSALVSWALVAFILFRTLRLGSALLWTILGAQLLLPVNASIKIAMIPQFDKASIPNLCALIGCLCVATSRIRIRGLGTTILIAAFILGPIFTSLQNGDPIFVGDRVLPGVGVYDGISAAIYQAILVIPFVVGRQFLRSSEDIFNVLVVLVIGELIYTIPLLFEMRFSPQLHLWIYGYYPSDFVQEMRDGGFRPMVFMGHGLLAAFFLMAGVVAATALWRVRIKVMRLPLAAPPVYLSVILLLSKSLGAAIYGFVLSPLVALAKPKLQLRIAAVFVSIALMYPILRSFDLFPTRTVHELASSMSEERAESMQTRFDHEANLLERASQRMMLGWGRYGRSRIYDSYGKDISLTDGQWIITLGQYGIIGFLAEFGLLSLGVFRAVKVVRSNAGPRSLVPLAALSLIVAVNILDLLPNAGLQPWTWLMSGALLGRSEVLLALSGKKRMAQEASVDNLGMTVPAHNRWN